MFCSESNIVGLHVEAGTVAAFREILADVAPELVLANHLKNDDFLTKPIRDLIPTSWDSVDGEQLLQPSH